MQEKIPYSRGAEISLSADSLPLESLCDYAFCPRLFGLNYIEKLPDTSSRLCNEMNDTDCAEKISLFSKLLGLTGWGLAFFEADGDGIPLADRPGRWKPVAALSRVGSPKPEPYERILLCAQTICLEEMFSTRINSAIIAGTGNGKLERVWIDNALRENTIRLNREMRESLQQKKSISFYYATKPKCLRCPRRDSCLPQLNSTAKVRDYIQNKINLPVR